MQEDSERFHSGFVRAGAMGLGLLSAISLVAGVMLRETPMVLFGLGAAAMYAAAFVLTRRGKGLLGRRIFVYGLVANTVLPALGGEGTYESLAMHCIIAALIITLAGFLLEQIDLMICVPAALAMTVVTAVKIAMAHGWESKVLTSLGFIQGFLMALILAVVLFVRNAHKNQRALRTYVEEVDRVMSHAERITKGDLAGQVEGDSDVSETIRKMLEGLRDMVTRTRAAATAISAAAQEVSAMARQQEQGAVEQASAVAQIHKTLARLLEGSGQAAHRTEDVFANVQRTQRTSEVVAERAAALSAHTRRISALLEVIKNIANKSEILALNAALEGARAGEAGRGFSLVASQMQRLAESVMGSVRDVRGLVEDIDAATAATLAATEESTQLSGKATAAARQISVTLQQQRASTEQVTAAMHDIQQVTAQVSAGTTQALSAMRDLTRLADELKLAIGGFQLD